jgi:hypothetical protein
MQPFGPEEEDVQRPPRLGVDPDALKRGDVPIGPNASGGSTGRGHDESSLTVNERKQPDRIGAVVTMPRKPRTGVPGKK